MVAAATAAQQQRHARNGNAANAVDVGGAARQRLRSTQQPTQASLGDTTTTNTTQQQQQGGVGRLQRTPAPLAPPETRATTPAPPPLRASTPSRNDAPPPVPSASPIPGSSSGATMLGQGTTGAGQGVLVTNGSAVHVTQNAATQQQRHVLGVRHSTGQQQVPPSPSPVSGELRTSAESTNRARQQQQPQQQSFVLTPVRFIQVSRANHHHNTTNNNHSRRVSAPAQLCASVVSPARAFLRIAAMPQHLGGSRRHSIGSLPQSNAGHSSGCGQAVRRMCSTIALPLVFTLLFSFRCLRLIFPLCSGP